MMKIYRVLAVLGMFSVLACSESGATLLNLSRDPALPDFTTAFVDVSYNAGSQLFQATGYTSAYTNGSAALTDYYDAYDYTLTATITGAGVLTSGTLTISGDIGSGVTNLLTGSLNTGADGTAFGSTAVGSGLFEFQFTVTGGNAAIVSDFGGLGTANSGIILFPEFSAGQFDGSWSGNFQNDGFSGFSDNFAVPEPSSAVLLVVGGFICVAFRRAAGSNRMT